MSGNTGLKAVFPWVSATRSGNKRKSEELAPRISHKEGSRIGIEPEKTENGADKREGDERNSCVFNKIGRDIRYSKS